MRGDEEDIALEAEHSRDLETGEGLNEPNHSSFIQMAAQAYSDSTDYFESSIYDNWRASVAHHRSEHEPGSKYHGNNYKRRSQIFRPKPRATERQLSASVASALFTNNDLVEVEGHDPNNQLQADAGKFHKALMQYRLQSKKIPWLLLVLGAFQSCVVYGICISRQQWNYKLKKTTVYEEEIDEAGNPVIDEEGYAMGRAYETAKVLSDHPEIKLIAPDNFRFDPNSDWDNVIGTSPYLIEMIPMFAIDVKSMMENPDDKTGKPLWKDYPMSTIIASGQVDETDGATVRDAREGDDREDPLDMDVQNEFRVVWVRFVIMRDTSGDDMCAFTIGDKILLTEPAPLDQVMKLGRDMYTMGFSIIEAFRTLPPGHTELARELTIETNEVANQRSDNVKLILNKRYAIKRGANVDLGAMARNVPGGGVLMDDLEAYKVIETNDVTQSSYAEQDRLAVETDDLVGTFSSASVQSNRMLNETVGGMNLMSSSANNVQELDLRVFIETWVEPVLTTMVKLEALYETDDVVMATAASRAGIRDEITEEMFSQDLVVKVNVGLGNTNPDQKMKRIMNPLNIMADLPDMLERTNFEEAAKEIWAAAGHGDGQRFVFTDEQMQQRAEERGEEAPDPRVVVAQINGELRQLEIQQDGILKQMDIQSKREIEFAKLAMTKEIKVEQLYQQLGVKREEMQAMEQLEARRDQTARDIAAVKAKLEQLTQRLQAQNLQQGNDTF